MEKNSGFATKQIHTGKIEIPGIAPLATPIFQTSTFEFETTAQGAHRFAGEEAGYIYTRLGNPNTTKIGEKLAALEHAEAGMAMASGMGAVTTVMWTVLHAGDHLLADDALYGCTFSFFTHGLTRYGVEVTLVDFEDLDAVRAAIRPNTKAFYFETPTNPMQRLLLTTRLQHLTSSVPSISVRMLLSTAQPSILTVTAMLLRAWRQAQRNSSMSATCSVLRI